MRWRFRQSRLQRDVEVAENRDVPQVTASRGATGIESGSDGLRRRPLFGMLLVDAESLEPVLEAILSGDRRLEGELPVLVTPNVDIIVMLDRAPDSVEADVFRRARYVLPDGMPLVASSGMLGQPLRARLTGSGLFELLWPRLAAGERPALVVCADEELRRRLAPSNPSASFVVPPIFDAESSVELEHVVDIVMAELDVARTEFVLFGLGHPKDALLANSLLQRWPEEYPRPLCLGLGGSFAMYAGLKKRAPELVQRIGAEWMYRFLQEPRRLFTRYFIRDVAFIGVLWRERRGTGRLRGERQRDER